MFKTLRNTKGNVLLQILAATAVMSTSFYFLTNYVIGQKEQVGKTANLVNLRFALNSAMDYVVFGVRQKYCFTNDDMLLNDAPDKCNLSHSGSIERLIMSTEQENFVKQLLASNATAVGPVDPNNITLPDIKRYMKVSTASTNHPLFPVLKSLRMVKGEDGKPIAVDGFSVEIEKDQSGYIPRAGREVYLKIKVALKTDKDSKPIVLGRTEMSLSSELIVYPREVGSFALLVPGDLHLDTTWDAGMAAGDVSIHRFSSRAELGQSPGLVFESPVFINKNIVLPLDNGDENDVAGSAQYSPVTFADRVYLGNGWVKANGKVYSPRSMGGLADRYWADARTFGGFLKGIENDGGLDKGLDVFKGGPGAGTGGSTLAQSQELMNKCQNLALRNASLDGLRNSKVDANLTNSTSTNYKYRMFLTNGNDFVRQWNTLIVKKGAWGDGQIAIDKDLIDRGGAILNMKIAVADRNVEFQLPRQGRAVVTAPVGSPAVLNTYTNNVTNAQAAATKAEGDLAKLNDDLAAKNKDLKAVKEQLSTEEAKPVKPATNPSPTVDYQDPNLITQYNSEIQSLKNSISTLEGKITTQENAVTTAKSNLDTAQSALANYKNLVANPPVIQVDTDTVMTKKNKVSTDKTDLSFSVQNAQSFIDANGNLVAPSIEVQAYDGSYFYSSYIDSKNSEPNPGLKGFLNFTFNASKTSLVAPYSVSNTPPDSTDYDDLAALCEEARNAQTSQSFGGAGWGVDFSGGTRISWNFAGGTTPGQDPGLAQLILENLHRSNATFQVRSIVGKCIIRSTADFVTGFFTCDSLEIEARNSPLRIIGSFIVGKMRIHPDALKAGITWSTIYSPQATQELRAAKVLAAPSQRDCNKKGADPIWHPIPSVQEVADRIGCNAISLRAKADPFQWTTVDPDCGLIPGTVTSNTSCKRRLVRFFVVEQSREGGI